MIYFRVLIDIDKISCETFNTRWMAKSAHHGARENFLVCSLTVSLSDRFIQRVFEASFHVLYSSFRRAVQLENNTNINKVLTNYIHHFVLDSPRSLSCCYAFDIVPLFARSCEVFSRLLINFETDFIIFSSELEITFPL